LLKLLAAASVGPLVALSLVSLGCSGKVIEADDMCASVSCGDHGTCSQGACACNPGYSGKACDTCAAGFDDPDGDGICVAVTSKDCDGVKCGAHGQCDAAGKSCICDTGYTGSSCSDCAPGFQDHDHDGTCAAACAYGNATCLHGSCDDASGTAVCVCDPGWEGLDCSSCTPDSQDNDHNGTCLPDCSVSPCESGSCDDTSGTAICLCDDGFQDNDENGTCLPDCKTKACGSHSACSDASGEALCDCMPGFAYDSQGNCVVSAGGCAAPIDLDIFQGQVVGTTTGAANDYQGSCQSESGPELVYQFVVADPIRLRFHMSGFDTVLYARDNCTSPSSELACSDDDGPNQSSIIERDFEPGSYFLFADGFGTASGQFTLNIELSCADGWVLDTATGQCVEDPCATHPCTQPHMTQCEPIPPTDFACHCDPGYIADPSAPNACIVDPNPHGEACADAIWLDPTQNTVQGSTNNASNEGTGTCGGEGPDRVYAFELNERSRVELAMSGFDTVLHLRSDCEAPSSELACDDDGGAGQGSLLVSILEPGSYYVFADSFAQGGNYELSYGFRPDPCAGDPCPGLPECVASPDWSTHSCVCPAGSLPYGNDCVDNPCEPNLCLSGPEHRWRCEPQLATDDYSCSCSPGYMDDPAAPGGACILDPNANEWSLFVYLNGDNNLESDAFDDLQEMTAAGSTSDVHIVVLLDTDSANGGRARKLYVTQGGYDELEDMGEIDMGDWETLADFGVWAVENYPARHYGLILWDHGDGWKGEAATSALTKAFSNDDHGTSDGISISNGDYARALQAISGATGDKLDFVGFDACLMGMWEVAEATAPYSHSFIASEELIPAWGWNYDEFLVPFVDSPETTATELGISIVDTYHDDDSDNSTLAVTNLDTLPELRVAMSAFADALRSDPSQYNKVETVRASTQDFNYGEYRDLWDFANRVATIGGASPELVAASQALRTQLDISIVYSRAQNDYPGAHGLSVYLPARGSHMDPDYVGAGAVWSQSTTWDDFLTSFAQ